MPINHPILLFTRRIGDFLFSPAGLAGIVLFAIVVFGCAYTVDQTEQVVITQFGRPLGTRSMRSIHRQGLGCTSRFLLYKQPIDLKNEFLSGRPAQRNDHT